MAALVHFVADPPQWVRFRPFGFANNQPSQAYQAGDRLSEIVAAGTFTNYRCTTPGTANSSAFAPNGVSPFTWGASVWTAIGSAASWADAATLCRRDYINYIDCDHCVSITSLSTAGPSGPSTVADKGALAYVFVDPGTMLPRTATRAIPNPIGKVFFGNLAQARGFHNRSRLGYASAAPPITTVVGSESTVDAVGTVSSAVSVAGDVGWRGVELTTTTTTALTAVVNGVAVKINAQSAASVTGSAPRVQQEAARRFGVHVNHSMVGTVLGVYNTTPTSESALYAVPAAFISDNAFAQGAAQWGSLGALQRTTSVFRTGAAVAPDVNHSFQFGGLSNCGPATLRTSPFFLFHNTLTGARTLTLHLFTDSPWDNDLTNLDIWADVFYPSSATNPKYSLVTSENANWGVPAAVAAALATDAAAWTSSGVFFPTAWKIAIALTPNRAGFIFVRFNVGSVKLARNLLFIDPFFEIA